MNTDQQPDSKRTGVPTLMPDPSGRIGNFQLQTLLARGGMCEVWKAWDTKAERPNGVRSNFVESDCHPFTKPRSTIMVAYCRKPEGRIGNAHPLVVVLLAGIFITLVALLLVVILRKGGENNGPPPPPPPPKQIDNPNRVQEIARKGKTYTMQLKGGFDARIEDKDWGIKQVINVAFAFEMPVTRTIESNDGRKIVELRQFGMITTTKLLSEVEAVKFDIGTLGTTLLVGGLEAAAPGSGMVALGAKAVAEAMLQTGAQMLLDENAKAFGSIDSLSGKKVRIVYVDGQGVTSVEPIDCELSESERDYVFTTAVLSDYYAMPDMEIKPGGTWTIDGGQLGGLLDPTLRGLARGEVVVARGSDREEGGKQLAQLRIQRGFLTIDTSDASRRRIGRFEPRGTLTYNITDSHIQAADMSGIMRIEDVSKDHILFEARFFTQPKLQISYSCAMQ